jgi:hypothetical protein
MARSKEIATGTEAIQAAAAAYRATVEAEAAAKAAKAAAAATLLAEMMAAGLSAARTGAGTVSVSDGRETIAITCKALAAEIEAMRQRSVRTGRGELRKGDPFVTLRR